VKRLILVLQRRVTLNEWYQYRCVLLTIHTNC
jgi:hypothetical protein